MKKLILFIAAILILLMMIIILFSPRFIYKMMDKVKIISIDCPKETYRNSSKRLNDKMPVYIEITKKNGIKKCKDLKELLENRDLVKVKNSRYYHVDQLTHSYPYLTKRCKDLLDTIGLRFREKLRNTGLRNTKFIITSMTRTVETVEKLTKRNSNASTESAHMYGECFDIAYASFTKPFTNLKGCHIHFLKETLAAVILELKKEKKCWALTESKIPCFHVVCR